MVPQLRQSKDDDDDDDDQSQKYCAARGFSCLAGICRLPQNLLIAPEKRLLGFFLILPFIKQ